MRNCPVCDGPATLETQHTCQRCAHLDSSLGERSKVSAVLRESEVAVGQIITSEQLLIHAGEVETSVPMAPTRSLLVSLADDLTRAAEPQNRTSCVHLGQFIEFYIDSPVSLLGEDDPVLACVVCDVALTFEQFNAACLKAAKGCELK